MQERKAAKLKKREGELKRKMMMTIRRMTIKRGKKRKKKIKRRMRGRKVRKRIKEDEKKMMTVIIKWKTINNKKVRRNKSTMTPN